MSLLSWKSSLPAIAVLAAAGWFIASPYMALASIKSAAEAGDSATVAAHIDFPELRASIKDQIAQQASAAMGGSAKQGGFGAAMAVGMMGGLVDQYVTPEGLNTLLAQKKAPAQPPKPRTTAWGTPMRSTPQSATPEVPTKWDTARTGLTTFEVRVAGDHPAAGAAGIFHLDGLTWTLKEVSLPPEAINSAMR